MQDGLRGVAHAEAGEEEARVCLRANVLPVKQNQDDTKPGSNAEADLKEQVTQPEAETEKGAVKQRKLAIKDS
jgi:hypothetical protein